MSSLILLVLLLGAVLYLMGGLVYLYRYLQARRRHSQLARVWEEYRKRFVWLGAVGVLLLAGFIFFAWWSLPGNRVPWLPNLFAPARQAAAPQAMDQGAALPAAPAVVTGRVPRETVPIDTTTTTTETTTTTSSTLTTTSPPPPTPQPPAPKAPAPKAKPAAPKAKPAAGDDAWTVCAASFRKKAMAQNYAQRLVAKGLPARVSQVDLGKRGVWHRVCVGGFPSLERARSQYKDWEKQGLISDAFLLPLR